ncbi:hypothetical protein FRB99_000409 [Tulasnella sp. 403]|nr:hypothetical protein FRB99_000409 [Tulasnella sp. 403]
MLFTYLFFVFFAVLQTASGSAIVRRQLPQFNIPTACQTDCGDYANTTAACASGNLACLCTSPIQRALVKCLECTIQAAGPANQNVNVGSAQQAVNLYALNCLKNANVTIHVSTITSFTDFPSATAASDASVTGSAAAVTTPASSAAQTAAPTGQANAAAVTSVAMSGVGGLLLGVVGMLFVML